jgi:membrane protein implicated in regulation of membrane protease activity
MLGAWWIWASAAVALAFVEVVVPGYVFLGFAIGAAVTAFVLLVGGPFAAALGGSVPYLLLFFAVVSLAGWLGLRRWLGVRSGQVKDIDHDINDN